MRSERGAAVPAFVALTALLLTVTMLCLTVGRVLVDQRRVATAADFSALAGAAAVQRGLPGCPAAERVARLNDAAVARCREVGDQVYVEAVLASARRGRGLPDLLAMSWRLTAHARAGPIELAR